MSYAALAEFHSQPKIRLDIAKNVHLDNRDSRAVLGSAIAIKFVSLLCSDNFCVKQLQRLYCSVNTGEKFK